MFYGIIRDDFVDVIAKGLVPEKYIEPTRNQTKGYKHLTLRVNCLDQFIELVNIIEDNKPLTRELLYRGMSDKRWLLLPSISRPGQELISCEHYLVRDFRKLKPDEFDTISDNFELLSKMQHYGLPTRLLDFTLNPLVALYFACGNSKRYDGRVVIHENYLDLDQMSYMKDFICSQHMDEMFCLAPDDYLLEDKYIKKSNSKPHKSSIEEYLFYIYILENNCIVTRPKYITDREKIQQSALMIFPNNLFDNVNKKIVNKEMAIIIRDDLKEKKENTIIEKRFVFDNSIKEIDEEELNENFISVIIDMESKDRILQQLDRIGINESFLFPELEYTAKSLKLKYGRIYNTSI